MIKCNPLLTQRIIYLHYVWYGREIRKFENNLLTLCLVWQRDKKMSESIINKNELKERKRE